MLPGKPAPFAEPVFLNQLPNIYLLTGPIRSGKTTALQRWADSLSGVGGFLTPDGFNGQRILQDLRTGKRHPFEAKLSDLSNQEEKLVEVGRFHFYEAGFRQGKLLMQLKDSERPLWTLIDEVGKLELRDAGWMPELETLIDGYRNASLHGNLLLVVRDSLLKEVIRKFSLDTATIWTPRDLK